MHETPRSIFPVADSLTLRNDGVHHENWRFELPRRGKTVLVRNQKSGKILLKLAWSGEKFQEEK